MLSAETVWVFFSASVLLGLAPGPDNIFLVTQSALYGRSRGLLVMLGLCTGLLFHSTVVALGVAVIFKTSVPAFTLLKFLGAAYLLYLAWQAFRASPMEMGPGAPEEKKEGRKLYFRGIIMNITNPKVGIFFLAFLPQFTDPERGSLSIQMLFLGGIFILSTILVFGSLALLAGSLGQFLGKSAKAQKVLNRIAALIFLGLALSLILTKM